MPTCERGPTLRLNRRGSIRYKAGNGPVDDVVCGLDAVGARNIGRDRRWRVGHNLRDAGESEGPDGILDVS